jgi:hypothetical protein
MSAGEIGPVGKKSIMTEYGGVTDRQDVSKMDLKLSANASVIFLGSVTNWS